MISTDNISISVTQRDNSSFDFFWPGQKSLTSTLGSNVKLDLKFIKKATFSNRYLCRKI